MHGRFSGMARANLHFLSSVRVSMTHARAPPTCAPHSLTDARRTMTLSLALLAAVAAAAVICVRAGAPYCQPSQPCW